jgi:predicted DNA-binding antitoxin AbrB/MazE fold protein
MLGLETGMSHTLRATFDGNVFRPDEPVELRPNTRVRLTVEPAEARERQSGSFLQVARSLRLEGPSDWSSRLDEYLYDTEGDS